MKRRWKVGIALAAVGLAGFLVWAFLSPSTPTLSIRFYGYMTNSAFRLTETLPPKDGSVLAIFAITNHTARAMVVHPTSVFRSMAGSTNPPVHWIDPTNHDFSLGESFPLFKPHEGALAGVRVYETDNPFSVRVGGWHSQHSNTAFGRLLERMPWKSRLFFVTATNELR